MFSAELAKKCVLDTRLYRKKGKKKKRRAKKGALKNLPFEKKRANSKKIKKGRSKGRFYLDEKKGWQ